MGDALKKKKKKKSYKLTFCGPQALILPPGRLRPLAVSALSLGRSWRLTSIHAPEATAARGAGRAVRALLGSRAAAASKPC